jgi:orotidine-5'-phosphate decarboxylase
VLHVIGYDGDGRPAGGIVGSLARRSGTRSGFSGGGIRTLGRLAAEAHRAGLLVILDAKRGDVGSTNDAYAEAFFGADAAIPVDALTVHPYLGFGARDALVERATQAGGCLLVVTRSSNPEGRCVQAAQDEKGRSVEAALLEEIGHRNAELAPGAIGPIGAVIRPTDMHPELDLISANALYLAPGVGAQGATASDVAQGFRSCRDRVMPSASRLLLDAGPEVTKLRTEVEALATVFKELLDD